MLMRFFTGVSSLYYYYVHKLDIEYDNNKAANKTKVLTTILPSVTKGARKYYDIVVKDNKQPTCCRKWENKCLNKIKWKQR